MNFSVAVKALIYTKSSSDVFIFLFTVPYTFLKFAAFFQADKDTDLIDLSILDKFIRRFVHHWTDLCVGLSIGGWECGRMYQLSRECFVAYMLAYA